MTLVTLTGYDVDVKKSGNALQITKKVIENDEEQTKKERIPLSRISGVMIGNTVHCTIPAIVSLLESGIPLVWMKGPYIIGVSHSFHGHGTVITRREQFIAYRDARGLQLAKGFVKAGLMNKANLLRSIAKNRNTDSMISQTLKEKAQQIRTLSEKLTTVQGVIDASRMHLMGIEGAGAEIYHQTLAELIPPEFEFKGRNRRFPKDPVNAALSYGYAILNSRTELMTVIAGLDPYGGFLHADRSGRPSLSIDLAEEFRQPLVDRSVLKLVLNGTFNPQKDFDFEENKVFLNKSGKEKLLTELMDRLEVKITQNNKKTSYNQAILHQARKIIHFLLYKSSTYEPFIPGW